MKRNLLIACGGMLGALARYGMKMSPLSQNPWHFPIHTLLTNLAGCFLIGAFLTATNEYLEIDTDIRVGIATGFIGAFTTFSTLCKETGEMFGSGAIVMGSFYAMLSLLLGFSSVYLGVFTVRKVFERLNPEDLDSDQNQGDVS